MLACNYLPFMLLPLLKAYERADRSLVLAALDLGATPWQAFWRVTFPITLPGAISGAALVFIPVSGEYLIPHFIGDGKVSVVGTLVMEWFDQRHWPYAAACATWLAAIVLVPIARVADLEELDAGREPARRKEPQPDEFRPRIRPPFAGWAELALGVVLAGMYLPVVMTFVYSFNASRIGTVWTGFSLHGYRELLAQDDLWRALAASCAIGAAASSLSVLAGHAGGPGPARTGGRRRRTLAQGVLALPLVTPDVILALSLAMFFSALRIEQGWGTVIAAHCVFGISYAFVVMTGRGAGSRSRRCSPPRSTAARRRGKPYCRVIVPILAPSLIVAWLFVFALSFDDFLITFLTKGPGTDTLPIKIYAQMRFGIKPQTSALFVILFLTTLAGALVASRLMRRRAWPT